MSRILIHRLKHLTLAACLMAATAAMSQPLSVNPLVAVQPISIGDTITVESTALGESRTINIYLPDGYASGAARYPVLYLIDGGLDQDFLHVVGTTQLGAIWGRSQPVIVVGIATKDRRRELAGPTNDPALLRRYPAAGRSADFRRFIAEEVQPMIAARYRTNGDDAVMGESLAGLFIVETWLRQPGLFDRYAAISLSLWWDNESIGQLATATFARDQATRPPLLIAPESEGTELTATAARFLAKLPSDSSVCRAPQSYNHANIYHAVTPMAIQYLFPPSQQPMPEFGFTLPCAA